MKFKQAEHQPYRENLIPFINIIFLLLIFFMVAGKIKTENPVVLPVSVSEKTDNSSQNILTIFSDGELLWQDKKYNLNQLKSLNVQNDNIIIRADEAVKANDFLLILEILRHKNIKNVHLQTRYEISDRKLVK